MSASFASLMYSFIGLPLLIIAALNVAGKKYTQKLCQALGIVVGVVQMITAGVVMALLLQFNKDAINFSQFWNLNIAPGAAYFSADILSLTVLFAVGMAVTASFASISALPADKRFNFTNLMMTLILGMNGVALVTDLFSLYVFLEVTSVSSFVLISLTREVRGLEGGFKYLVMSAIASAFILAGLALLFLNSGSLRYEDVSLFLAGGAPANPLFFWLALLLLTAGLSIKSGLVPFHGWLPDAYQSAPAPVSVVLGGVVTKVAGVYVIIRILGDLSSQHYSVMNTAFMLLALVSVVLGALAALGQDDFKRVLAYSSISQIGYIVLGIACGNILGFIGAMLHFFNHATFKTTLFVSAAALSKQVKTTDISKLGGLQKRMPFTSAATTIALLSTAGIPPLAGFWSKLLIILAAWEIYGPVVGGIALMASIFTCAYFLRLQRSVFFGPARPELAEVTEARGGIRIAAVLLTMVTIAMGVCFPVLLQILQFRGLM